MVVSIVLFSGCGEYPERCFKCFADPGIWKITHKLKATSCGPDFRDHPLKEVNTLEGIKCGVSWLQYSTFKTHPFSNYTTYCGGWINYGHEKITGEGVCALYDDINEKYRCNYRTKMIFERVD